MNKLFLILLLPMLAYAGPYNEVVTQETLQQTVCIPEYMQSIRPPTSYTQAWEREHGGGLDTIVDHKTPLCAGGNPTDTSNLQLQYKAESYRKDVAERLVCKLLCDGILTLKDARRIFWQ